MAQWFNSFVYRRKQNGKLRLHLKTNKDFNAAIQIEHHVALSLEEILLNLKDAKVLSYNGEKNADTETWSGEKSLLTLLLWEIQVQAHALIASKCLKRSSGLRWTRHLKANG